MKRQSFTKLRSAPLALVVVTMAMSAMAQVSPNRTPQSGCGPVDCTGTINAVAVSTVSTVVLLPAQPLIVVGMNITGGPSNCQLVFGLYFGLVPGTPGYDQMYSLLLKAYATGETVTIRTKVATNIPGLGSFFPCGVDYVVLKP
jgi:hypothetical protein